MVCSRDAGFSRTPKATGVAGTRGTGKRSKDLAMNWYKSNTEPFGSSAVAVGIAGTRIQSSVQESAWIAQTQWLPPISVEKFPTHVVLDIGCTKPMGSRRAVEAFD